MPNDVDANVEASLRYLASGAGWLFLGIFTSKILAYVYRAFIARTLPVSDYGIFNLAVMLTTLAATIAALGLTQGLSRYVPYYRAKNDAASLGNALKFVLIITLISSLFITSIIYLFSEQISGWFGNGAELSILIKYLSLHIPFSVLGLNVFLFCLLYFSKAKLYSLLFNVVLNVVRLGGAVAFVLLGFGILGVGISYVLSFVVVGLLAFYFFEFKTFSIFKPHNKEACEFKTRDFLSYSWPLLFVAIIGSINGWIDSFMIGHLMTVKDVGVYNGALPVSQLLLVIPSLIAPLFLPLLSGHLAKNECGEIGKISKRVFKWIFAANFFVFLVMLAFPGALINFIFGRNYLAGTQVLSILSFGFLALSLAIPFSQLLELHKKTKLILVNISCIVIINIILNYFLIPIYGINGAAIATTISNCALALLVFLENYFLTKTHAFSRANIKIFFAGAITFAGLLTIRYFARQYLLALILAGLLMFGAYSWILFKSKVIDEEDKKIIRIFEEKTKIKIPKILYKW